MTSTLKIYIAIGIVAAILCTLFFSLQSTKPVVAPYDFSAPAKVAVLDKELKEISGLTYSESRGCILTHNDEKGTIYKLDRHTFKITGTYDIGKKDDYEGITIINNEPVLVTSNGRLHFYESKSQRTDIAHTLIGTSSDVEGLCYLQNENKLLLACKGQPKEIADNQKAIYAYNLQTQSLEKDPYLIIATDDLSDFVNKTYTNIIEKGKLQKRVSRFAPSGLAIMPETNDLYVLSSRGSSLAVYGADKTLKGIYALNSASIPQPEGICFDKDQSIYISTEGKKGPAKLYKYTPIR